MNDVTLPESFTAQQIRFVAEATEGLPIVARFPALPRRYAVVATQQTGVGQIPEPSADFALVTVAHEHPEDYAQAPALRAWVETSSDAESATLDVHGSLGPTWLTLYGAQIWWSPRRAVAVVPADRLAAVQAAIVEFAGFESELRQIENQLASQWSELEEDSPLAFEVAERDLTRRATLAARFRRLVQLRARAARLTPSIHRPHLHPPTLASQVGERLRERTRLAERLEVVEGQLELFERVYDQCAQRAGDFALARRGHLLEWVIIVLLAGQTLLALVERLSANAT